MIDEAQDLSPMQWRMVGRRGKYASWTVVGDPLQSSWPDPDEAASARTSALGPRTTRRQFQLRTNYRNSAEIFELAAQVVTDVATPGQLPHAVRSTGVKPSVRVVDPTELAESLRAAARQLLDEMDGTVGVITRRAGSRRRGRSWRRSPTSGCTSSTAWRQRASSTTRWCWWSRRSWSRSPRPGPRTLYVALTRATQRLTVLTSDPAWP